MPHRHDLPAPHWIVLDDARIATYVLEPRDRRPVGDVVLCHGTPWSAAVWAQVAHHLAADHRVLLYDMPGYGASIGPDPADVDLPTQSRRLAALLARWGTEAPHVIAHDIGGAVALGAHLVEGARMASLYLLDIVTLDPWGSPFFRLVAQHEEAFAALPGNLHAALVREYIAGAAHGTLAADLVAALARPWCTEDGQPAFYRQIAQLSPEHTRPIAEALGTVSCPVRVAWGEADPWIPSTQAAELAARLPGDVDAVLFPGAGHLVPLEAGDHLAADIAAWVGAHGSPGSVGPHTAG